ncbi:MAG TPA: phosphoribosylanthranilate isomerase [Pyrinomonadaceae bacterium]|nr:phosphoribosylanthranilate isomerase [Pyrinomonadaceae bacterium]
MVKVKICGITNFEDAVAATDSGADMLGFNFYRPSSRYIEPGRAREIVERLRSDSKNSSPTMVGVFVDEAIDSIVRIVNEVRLDAVQLHGDESPEFCAELKSFLPAKAIIKALRVNGSFDPQTASRYSVQAIMLDAFHEQLRGGTGRVIDWDIASAVRKLVPQLFLSGGLSPENVAEAISRVQPFAVDACSSLESSPGRKDAARVKEFVRAVRNG